LFLDKPVVRRVPVQRADDVITVIDDATRLRLLRSVVANSLLVSSRATALAQQEVRDPVDRLLWVGQARLRDVRSSRTNENHV